MASHSHGSSAHGSAPHDSKDHGSGESHESFIKTPKQLVVVVLIALIAPIVVIMLLANFVSLGPRTGTGADAMTPERIVERIRPVAGLELRDASGSAAPRAGVDIYKTTCSACHDSGAAGAPKLGDKAGWAARIGNGLPALVTSALKGKGAMPAQGGGDSSDYEITRAVVYLANEGGAKFEEPPAPAAKPAESK